ncbi:MAG: hypothetical protein MJZ03_03395 [archaeon]|nr:hypothetical protein [archaeon]
MLVTIEQLQKFSGVYPDDDSLQKIYIGSASQTIADYVGFDVETSSEYANAIPDVFKFVCLEIATLMQEEESQNLGINSKSFGESGTRTFLNVVDYSKYLRRLDSFRKDSALSL